MSQGGCAQMRSTAAFALRIPDRAPQCVKQTGPDGANFAETPRNSRSLARQQALYQTMRPIGYTTGCPVVRRVTTDRKASWNRLREYQGQHARSVARRPTLCRRPARLVAPWDRLQDSERCVETRTTHRNFRFTAIRRKWSFVASGG